MDIITSKTNNKVKLINLAKNMNRPGALMAGMSKVTGDYIILMDDDGQCPMENLWNLIKPLEEGHDVSIAKMYISFILLPPFHNVSIFIFVIIFSNIYYLKSNLFIQINSRSIIC